MFSNVSNVEELMQRKHMCGTFFWVRAFAHSSTMIVEANQMFRVFLIVVKHNGFVNNGRINLRPLNACFGIYLIAMGLSKTGAIILSTFQADMYPANLDIGRMCMKLR